MHHHPAQVTVGVHQRLHAQPVEQLARIVGEQHALQVGVDLALFLRASFADGEQRQIVVAEHDDALRAQRMHQPQRFQRLPAAVDEVAAEPQAILPRDRT